MPSQGRGLVLESERVFSLEQVDELEDVAPAHEGHVDLNVCELLGAVEEEVEEVLVVVLVEVVEVVEVRQALLDESLDVTVAEGDEALTIGEIEAERGQRAQFAEERDAIRGDFIVIEVEIAGEKSWGDHHGGGDREILSLFSLFLLVLAHEMV